MGPIPLGAAAAAVTWVQRNSCAAGDVRGGYFVTAQP
jgi:hypothetical protein